MKICTHHFSQYNPTPSLSLFLGAVLQASDLSLQFKATAKMLSESRVAACVAAARRLSAVQNVSILPVVQETLPSCPAAQAFGSKEVGMDCREEI